MSTHFFPKRRKRKVQSYGIILLRRNITGQDGFIKPNVFWDCEECKKCSIVCQIQPTTTDYSVLIMQKRNSHAYYDIVCGRIFRNSDTQKLIDELSCAEKRRICKWSFDKLWCSLWTYDSVKRNHWNEDRKIAEEAFKSQREHYLECIAKSQTHYPLSEFGFPKGRKNFRETSLNCALREFYEETGYDRRKILIPDHSFKITEEFVGSDGVTYNHTYYIGELLTPEALPEIKKDNCEVKNLGWLPLNGLESIFRPYEKSKIGVLEELKVHLQSKKSFIVQ